MNLIVVGIIACEVGFWAVLAGGLGARYILRRRRLSNILLLCVPLLDFLLLCMIGWDLLVNDVTADFAHGLGAVYLGFTVAFGRQIIARVDAWFAHRFAGGPAPLKPPQTGLPYVKHEWRQWTRMLLTAVITSAVIGTIVLLVGDASRTGELVDWVGRVWLVTGIWLIAWPVWATGSHFLGSQPSSSPPSSPSE